MTFQELNQALIPSAETLCAQLLPGGTRKGREWLAGSTAGEKGQSLHVVLEGARAGRWKDFSSDEGGDLLNLIEKAKGTDAKGAAEFARSFLGLPPWAPDKDAAPVFNPLRHGFKRREETEWRYGTAAWTYRDATGAPAAWVVRFDLPDGKKEIMPIRMVDGKPRWKGYTRAEKRPLYNLDKITARPDAPVLVVEGEKTADAAAKLFPGYVATTFMGGIENVRNTDWNPLLERATPVVLWADADKPGRKAMAYLAQLIEGSKRVKTTDLPEKWDLADPAPEGIDLNAKLDLAIIEDPDAVAKKKKQADKEEQEGVARYHLPYKCELSAVESHILKYKVFEHAGKVYGMRGNNAVEISNSTVYIHRHVPTKDGAISLVTLKNVEEAEPLTMDVPFDVFTTGLNFTKWLGNQGNFQWWGTDLDFTGYKRMQMDRMKKCTLITELGTQPNGMFVFNNACVDASVVPFDADGCFQLRDRWYYVPSGSSFYKEDPSAYSVQKLVSLSSTELDFHTWNKQMVRVYGEHAYMATAFTLATAFSDHIFKLLKGFPVMFLYGPGGSGKDQLIKSCQSVFGDPQPEIFLTGPNTDKGLIKMFAEFQNIILNLAEYRKGMKKDMDELLKSMWGRIGYRLAAMRGKKTETIGIHCSAMVSGNDMPTDMA